MWSADDHDHDGAHHHEHVDADVDARDDVTLDPSLPELNIGDADLLDWVTMTDDITGTRKVPVSSQNAVAF